MYALILGSLSGAAHASSLAYEGPGISERNPFGNETVQILVGRKNLLTPRSCSNRNLIVVPAYPAPTPYAHTHANITLYTHFAES